jgi:putative tryptophan/tyrosine transport system substrate-binding protein
MKPRQIVLRVILAFAFLAAPLPSDGQQPAKIYRVGFLAGNMFAPTEEAHPQKCPTTGYPNWQAFVEGLRERGYIPGQNLAIECRWTDGQEEERAPALAAELVGLKPDLIVATSTAKVRAVKQVTGTIPIVMVGVLDPVRRGLVASLAHPGGNVTGLTDKPMEMVGKRLQLLKEAVPTVSRVAVLTRPSATPEPHLLEPLQAAARALDVTLQFYEVRAPEELEGAFAAMTKAREEALFMTMSPLWQYHRERIIELTAQSRLPAMYHDSEFVKAGGLMAYDTDQPAIFRRIGSYVDKILNGANPGDLPVEQPTRFELIINLKTAAALDLTIPESLLNRADELIR